MLGMMKTSLNYCAFKVDGFFKRVFKEQAGGAEIVATIVILGIVLVIALAFKTQLQSLVKTLWEQVTGAVEKNKTFTVDTVLTE
ncbi:MAG: hypothetical protein IJV50_01640 [Lachnospiraceae bacterium]|nr:hypothetical protein [Lachnospiraceae bacterium]